MKQVTYTTRKTILSILALVLTFIALGTTTFAWFSLSTVSKISQITGEVRGGEGLSIRLVSRDGTKSTEWKANLNETDVSNFINSIKLSPEMNFTAVSGTEIDLFKKQALIGNKLLIDGADAVANADYLEFRIEFKSDTGGTVELQSYDLTGTTGLLKTPVEFIDSSNTTRPVGYDVEVNASNAARFALVEKNSDNDVINKVVYQKPEGDGYDGNVANNEVLVRGQWDFLRAVGEELHLSTIPIGSGLNGSLLFDDVEDQEFLEAEVEVDGVKYALAQQGGTVEFFGGVDITIWLEGWDVDTYDVIYNAFFYLDLQFVKESID